MLRSPVRLRPCLSQGNTPMRPDTSEMNLTPGKRPSICLEISPDMKKEEHKTNMHVLIASTIEKELAKVCDNLKTTILDTVQDCMKNTVKESIDDHLEQLHFDLKSCKKTTQR